MRRSGVIMFFALLLAACHAAAPAQTGVTRTPAATVVAVRTLAAEPGIGKSVSTLTVTPTQMIEPTLQSTLEPTAQPEPLKCESDENVCILAGHFFLQRPIPLEANASVDDTYRYGLTQSGKREPHHGVEFPNAQATPVLAAASGVVVFAGEDKKVSIAWVPAFYGNVVVIAHEFPGLRGKIFSLYGHLFKIEVSAGQQVSAGQKIGQVGATGTAIGSHLHFEVRVGQNDYRSNRNPDLWLVPLAGTGVLAGRIEDAKGRLMNGMLNVQRIENGVLNVLPVTALETYVLKESQPVRNDDVWLENFAAGELRAGEYRLTLHVNGLLYDKVVTVEPDRLTFVIFVVK